MKKLKRIGFFKELRYGDADGESINSKIDSVWIAQKDKIIDYLQQGVTYILSPGMSMDYFEPKKAIGTGPYILTDGYYAWPSDLAYYFSNYEVNLPSELIKFMQNSKWRIKKENIDLEELEL